MIATRNRRERLSATLGQLESLPGTPPIVVVDNGSADGTAEHLGEHHRDVEVIRLDANCGAVARNAGVERLDSPYVAFSDDDSWWASDALRRAELLFDRHPRLGLIAARVVVEPAGRLDPTCLLMRASPLPPERDLPGRPVLGFVACGSIVRRAAFRSVGGFSDVLRFGGEESLLAIDLAASGWGVAYVDAVVAHHEPAPRDRDAVAERRGFEMRNALWTTWLRRPLPSALRRSGSLLATAAREGQLAGAREAVQGLPKILRERRSIPAALDRRLATVERSRA